MPEQQFLDFVSRLGVMKPATIDEENKKQVLKLESLLLASDYCAEEKVDGCHYLLIGHRFFSSDGVEKTHNFPHLSEFFASLNMPNLILDGEINYPGKTSQFCTRVTGSLPKEAVSFQNNYSPIHYTMWDILRTPKGTWMINETLNERRKVLEYFHNTYIKPHPVQEFMHLTNICYDNKKYFYEDIIANGKEGIVLKNLNSLYVMGKRPMWQWMKLKQKDWTDFFISGYEEPKAEYGGSKIEDWPYWTELGGMQRPVTKYYYHGWIGALILSAYVDGQPTKICTCSGMSEEIRRTISENKQEYLNRVVKISYMEKTEAGKPRHPRFEQFHESKKSHECTWELSLEG